MEPLELRERREAHVHAESVVMLLNTLEGDRFKFGFTIGDLSGKRFR